MFRGKETKDRPFYGNIEKKLFMIPLSVSENGEPTSTRCSQGFLLHVNVLCVLFCCTIFLAGENVFCSTLFDCFLKPASRGTNPKQYIVLKHNFSGRFI